MNTSCGQKILAFRTMKDLNRVESVSERDIDLLILEELNVSYEFASWFYQKITGNSQAPELVQACHSVKDRDLGESDLIALYKNNSAILIENKIDAVAQPEQALRYKLRGSKGIEENHWCCFTTCMIAPKLYLDKEKDARVYQATLSYEAISEWFLSRPSSDTRSQYRSYIVDEAIEQNRRGYTIQPDDKVTLFWSKYWKYSIQEHQFLNMKKPGLKPGKADWPEFRPSCLNNKISIVHKLERGDIDLQISGAAGRVDTLKEYL